jgi:hypothetical protein
MRSRSNGPGMHFALLSSRRGSSRLICSHDDDLDTIGDDPPNRARHVDASAILIFRS